VSDHAESPSADHAGVRVPPPLIYAALFGLGALLQQLAPFIFLPAFPARVAALIFLGAGVLLAGWSVLLFRRAHPPGAD